MKIEVERLHELVHHPARCSTPEISQMAKDLIAAHDLGIAPKRNRVKDRPLTIQKECKQCKQAFQANNTRIGRDRVFCSPKCASEYRRQHFYGTNTPKVIELWNGGMMTAQIAGELKISRARVQQILGHHRDKLTELPEDRKKKANTFTCLKCGKEFISHNYDRKFCSKECFLSERPLLPKSSHLLMLTFTCDGCGVKFERSGRLENIHRHAGAKRHFCSVECYRKQSPAFGPKANRTASVIEKIKKELSHGKATEGIQGRSDADRE